MSPQRAIELVAERCKALGGLPVQVALTDNGDPATGAVARWFRDQNVSVELVAPSKAETPEARACDATLQKSLQIAFDMGGMSPGCKAPIGWAVLQTKAITESGEDKEEIK